MAIWEKKNCLLVLSKGVYVNSNEISIGLPKWRMKSLLPFHFAPAGGAIFLVFVGVWSWIRKGKNKCKEPL